MKISVQYSTMIVKSLEECNQQIHEHHHFSILGTPLKNFLYFSYSCFVIR